MDEERRPEEVRSIHKLTGGDELEKMEKPCFTSVFTRLGEDDDGARNGRGAITNHSQRGVNELGEEREDGPWQLIYW